MSERITRKQAVYAAGHLAGAFAVVADSDEARWFDTALDYIHQEPEPNPDAEVLNEVQSLIWQIVSNATDGKWRWLATDSFHRNLHEVVWEYRVTSDNDHVPIETMSGTLPELRDKLREMVKPPEPKFKVGDRATPVNGGEDASAIASVTLLPTGKWIYHLKYDNGVGGTCIWTEGELRQGKPSGPTLDEVAAILEGFRFSSHSHNQNAALDTLKRHVAALRAKEAADQPSEEPDLEARECINSVTGYRYYVSQESNDVAFYVNYAAIDRPEKYWRSPRSELNSRFESRSDAQTALDKYAAERGWEVVK
jgi:hypothetical protein